MNPKANPAVTAWCIAVFALWGSAWAAAQPTASESPPSVEAIEQRLVETSQNPDLDDDAKAGIHNLYQQALSELESAARWRVTALDFARRTTEAPAALEALEAAPEDAPPILVTDSVDTLEQRRAAVDGQLAEAASRLSEADREPLRRTSRRAEIRETLAALADETARVEAELEAPTAPDASLLEADARQALLSARRLQLETRTTSLQRELGAYDAERSLLPHRRELAARDVARLQEQVTRLAADCRRPAPPGCDPTGQRGPATGDPARHCLGRGTGGGDATGVVDAGQRQQRADRAAAIAGESVGHRRAAAQRGPRGVD